MGNQEIANQGQSDNQPATQQADVVSPEHLSMVSASAEMWSGPIPPPQVLRGYEDIIPGAADRILKMAERQSEHRLLMEKALISDDSKRSYMGLLAGFILSVMVIGGGIYLISTGHDLAGASLIGLNLAGLAGIFVYGSKSRNEQHQQTIEPNDPDR